MTRINVGLKPRQLIDQHLLAEYRELPRALTLATKKKKTEPVIPYSFKLGTGHVTFFYNKLMFLHNRYNKLVEELKVRGFCIDSNVVESVNRSFINAALDHPDLYHSYNPTIEACKVVKDRLSVVLKKKIKEPRYYGRTISKNSAVKLLSL